MNFNRHVRTLRRVALIGGVALLFASEALARVGGGGSYGGGGGSGGGGGGGAGAIVYLLVRFLLWLTIEHPVIGIPVDIIVIALVIFWFLKPSKKSVSVTSSPIMAAAAGAGGVQQLDVERAFNQLRRFDPKFSEIIFTDFCYALYGRAHDARGHGATALDLLSPYLSAAARTSLLQLNPPNLKAVQGIIVGAIQVIDVRGLDTPTIGISIGFEANYTEFTPREGDPRGEMSYYVRERWELERK